MTNIRKKTTTFPKRVNKLSDLTLGVSNGLMMPHCDLKTIQDQSVAAVYIFLDS